MVDIYRDVTIYECSHCWKIFDGKDIVIQGNGELSCKDCYIKELNEQVESDDAINKLKLEFVNGKISSEEYTEKMSRL